MIDLCPWMLLNGTARFFTNTAHYVDALKRCQAKRISAVQLVTIASTVGMQNASHQERCAQPAHNAARMPLFESRCCCGTNDLTPLFLRAVRRLRRGRL
jgi:hypothetical protein